jgi:hypothetical protein
MGTFHPDLSGTPVGLCPILVAEGDRSCERSLFSIASCETTDRGPPVWRPRFESNSESKSSSSRGRMASSRSHSTAPPSSPRGAVAASPSRARLKPHSLPSSASDPLIGSRQRRAEIHSRHSAAPAPLSPGVLPDPRRHPPVASLSRSCATTSICPVWGKRSRKSTRWIS